MFKKLIPAVAVLGLAATAQAQTSPETNLLKTTTQGNGNVTKVDGNVAGIDVRGISNPAQTRVRLQDTPVGKVQVRVKDGDPSNVGDLSDIDLDTRSNRNVTKVDGTIGNVDVRGISTPGTTNVTVKPPKG